MSNISTNMTTRTKVLLSMVGLAIIGLLGLELRGVLKEINTKLDANSPENLIYGLGVLTDYSTSLASSISSSATSIVVSSITDRSGKNTITFTSSTLGDAIYFALEPGTSRSEVVRCTALSGTTFSGCTRGLSFGFNGCDNVASSTLQIAHNAGTKVVNTNVCQYTAETVAKDTDQVMRGKLTVVGNQINLGSGSATTTNSVLMAFESNTGPYLRFNQSTNGWEFSNDGTTSFAATSTTAVGLAGTGINVNSSIISVNLMSTSTGGLGFSGSTLGLQLTNGGGNLAFLSDGLAMSTTTNRIWGGSDIWQGTSSTFSGNLNVKGLYVSSTLLTATHTSSTIPLLAVGYIGSTSTSATTTFVNNLQVNGNVYWTGNNYSGKPIVYTQTTTGDYNGTTGDITWDYTDFPYTPSLLTLYCSWAADNISYGTASAVGSQQSLIIKTAASGASLSTTQILEANYGGATDEQWKVTQMSATSTILKITEAASGTVVINCLWTIQ